MKRTKDAAGNYYCNPCWTEHVRQAKATVAPESPPVDVAHPARSSSRVTLWIVTGALGVCLVIAIPAYFIFSNAAKERATSERYAAIRDEAVNEAGRGELHSALQKYEKLLQIAQQEGRTSLTIVKDATSARQRLTEEIAAKELAVREEENSAEKERLAQQQAARDENARVEHARVEQAKLEEAKRIAAVRAAEEAEVKYKSEISSARAKLRGGLLREAFVAAKSLISAYPKSDESKSVLADVAAAISTSVTFRESAMLNGHAEELSCVKISPNGQTVASASVDGVIKLWDLNTRQCLQTVPLRETITGIAFGPDSKALFAGFSNQKFIKLNVSTGKTEQAFGQVPIRL